jgi:hypothetical protein
VFTPDGKYYNAGVLVADKFDGTNYFLNDENVGIVEFDSFEDNTVDINDFSAFVDIWLNPANKSNYSVYSSTGFFSVRGRYCDNGVYSLTGSGDVKAQDVVAFSKYFANAASKSLSTINVGEIGTMYAKYQAQLTETSSENFKTYVELLGVLKDTLTSAESCSTRFSNLPIKLQEFADNPENHDVNINDLLSADPDTL